MSQFVTTGRVGLRPGQSGLRPSSLLQLWDAENLLNPRVLVPTAVERDALTAASSTLQVAGGRPSGRMSTRTEQQLLLLRDHPACWADSVQKNVLPGRGWQNVKPQSPPGRSLEAQKPTDFPCFQALASEVCRAHADCEVAQGGTLGARGFL